MRENTGTAVAIGALSDDRLHGLGGAIAVILMWLGLTVYAIVKWIGAPDDHASPTTVLLLMVGNVTLFVLLLDARDLLHRQADALRRRRKRDDAEQLALAIGDDPETRVADSARGPGGPPAVGTARPRIGRPKHADSRSPTTTSSIAPAASTRPSRRSAACVVVGGISSRWCVARTVVAPAARRSSARRAAARAPAGRAPRPARRTGAARAHRTAPARSAPVGARRASTSRAAGRRASSQPTEASSA